MPHGNPSPLPASTLADIRDIVRRDTLDRRTRKLADWLLVGIFTATVPHAAGFSWVVTLTIAVLTPLAISGVCAAFDDERRWSQQQYDIRKDRAERRLGERVAP